MDRRVKTSYSLEDMATLSLATNLLYHVSSSSSVLSVTEPGLASLLPKTCRIRPRRSISSVHAAESAETPVVTNKPKKLDTAPAPSGKWAVGSWRAKKALQLPEYPDEKELAEVLRTIESFPPIVFAGEARHLEERLADAAVGWAFLLQGGDCAESFKEFNANNIRDTFRVLLQMGAVLMFGGQMPVVRVRRRQPTEIRRDLGRGMGEGSGSSDG
ncbi:hypothetical protein GW17_00037185 [Ensete ventricosum]|nr:hypothetical protein GW17_00037185 [Ensete ventricosum]RZS16431.1 hypothetical protein BHM03_00048413 [Ensete ventricosum]